jgi:hypothetical protein
LCPQQRILQLNGAGIGLKLVRSLWAKIDPAVPSTVCTIAKNKQSATVQADHSSSP